MRFVMVSLPCLFLLFIGCLFFRPSGELRNKPEQSHTYGSDYLDSTNTENTNGSIKSIEAEAQKHFMAFHSLLPTDPESARAELSKYITTLYGEHSLTSEWVQLVFRMMRNGKGSLSDQIRLIELKVQMLKDVYPEMHAESIEMLEKTLKQLDGMAKILKNQGENPETFEMEFTFAP